MRSSPLYGRHGGGRYFFNTVPDTIENRPTGCEIGEPARDFARELRSCRSAVWIPPNGPELRVRTGTFSPPPTVNVCRIDERPAFSAAKTRNQPYYPTALHSRHVREPRQLSTIGQSPTDPASCFACNRAAKSV